MHNALITICFVQENMKEFINSYYRLFCSKYAEDILRFINSYDFAKKDGKFRYIYEYSEWKPEKSDPYWDNHTLFHISEVWTATCDLFYIMSDTSSDAYVFNELFTKIIKVLCTEEAGNDTTIAVLDRCEAIIKHLIYTHFKIKENPHNGNLTIATCAYAFKDTFKSNSNHIYFHNALHVLAATRNLGCHKRHPKEIEDSNRIRLRFFQYIISVIIGIVVILNKYKPSSKKYPPILEPLKVKIKKTASDNISITSVSWRQNESDYNSIEQIEGSEIREFTINVQRYKPISFSIDYICSGESKKEYASITLNLSDNINYVLEICLPDAQKNHRFKDKANTSDTDDSLNIICRNSEHEEKTNNIDTLLENAYESLFQLIGNVTKGRLHLSDKILTVDCLMLSHRLHNGTISIVWQCEITGIEQNSNEYDQSYIINNSSIDLTDSSTGYLTIEMEDLCLDINVPADLFNHEYNLIGISEGAFYRYPWVEIKLPPYFSIKTSGFANNTRLRRVYLGEYNTVGPSAFKDCANLQSIYYIVPDNIVYICKQAFMNCSNLVSITINSTPEEESFAGCKKLKYVIFNNGLEKITRIGKGLFRGCKSLEDIKIPETVVEIDKRAFYNCSSLKKINIPARTERIGEEAFAFCSSLEEIYFEDISNTKEIHTRAFYGCTRSLKIHAGWNQIGCRDVLTVAEFIKKYGDRFTEQDIFDPIHYKGFIARLFIILMGIVEDHHTD